MLNREPDVIYGFDQDLTDDQSPTRAAMLGQVPCVVNASVPPYEVLAMNAAWSKLCGYGEESLGDSPSKLLQGAGTDRKKAAQFTSQLMDAGAAATTLLNYRNDGTAFVHRIHSMRDSTTDAFITRSCEVDPQDPVATPIRAKAGLRRAGSAWKSGLGGLDSVDGRALSLSDLP